MTRTIAIGIIAAMAGLIGAGHLAEAKSLREAEIPAEFPPASYTGKQYVDSRGCVYIRAGIDGMVNWVPRVTRAREVLCGYKPTFAKAETAPAPAPAAKPAAVPVIAPKPAPAAEPKPKAAPVKSAEPKAKPAPRRVVQKAAPKPAAPAPQPRPVVKKAPAKPVIIARPASAAPQESVKPPLRSAKAAPSPRQVTSCAGVTGISRYYAGRGGDVRCGPQTTPFVTVVRREPVTVMRNGKKVTVQRRVVSQQPAAGATAAAPVRVVPRHVWEQQQAAKVHAPVPEGYRKVWTDDRLNTKRAHQTFAGIHATDLAWTRTVPRKLYKRDTGLVVTQNYPGLKYPYVSYAEMRAAGYEIGDDGKPLPPHLAEHVGEPQPAMRVIRKKRSSIVATKSEPRTAPAVAAKGRYVQVGTFGVPANAQRTAARLQSSGLPARLGTLKKGGKSYRIVLAGPFAPDQLGAALRKARAAGFHDAFVR